MVHEVKLHKGNGRGFVLGRNQSTITMTISFFRPLFINAKAPLRWNKWAKEHCWSGHEDKAAALQPAQTPATAAGWGKLRGAGIMGKQPNSIWNHGTSSTSQFSPLSSELSHATE